MPVSLAALGREPYDVLVIGGGATGAGVALDAVGRGLRVALVDRADFGAGTSSLSTKLAHGGVRYLEQAVRSFDRGQLRLVTSALRERAHLLAAAPHLAHPAQLVIPLRSFWQRCYYGIGLSLYEWLAGKRSLGKSRGIGRDELRRLAPQLAAHFVSGVIYYDGSFDDARFALELVLSAEARGAHVRNYTEVTRFEMRSGRVEGAQLRDSLSGEQCTLRAQHVIHCTGPHADHLRLAVRPDAAPRLRPSQGIHIVLDRSWWPSDTGLLIPRTSDGRVLFCMPFESKVLVGTTDTEVADVDAAPAVRERDIAFVLETFSHALGIEVPRSAVRAAWAGYRPLVASQGVQQTARLIRDHEVEVWEHERILHVLGGKWTTYRAMAEDAVNRLCALRGETRACVTAEQRLLRAIEPDPLRSHPALQALPADIAHQLLRYGSAAVDLALAVQRQTAQRILPELPYTWAELQFNLDQEHVRTMADLLDRRWRIGMVDDAARAALAERLGAAFAADGAAVERGEGTR